MLIWLLLAVGLGALLVGSWRLVRNRPRLGVALAGAALFLIIAKAVLHHQPYWEARLFPWTWYIYLQGSWLYLVAMVFFGLALARLPVRWNRVVVAGLALGVLGYGLHAHRWIAWSEDHGDGRTVDARGHLCQSTLHTCAPAACAMALAQVGIVRSEREMARLCLTR